MVQSKEFRVCTSCTPPHVENCSKCFGYGLAKGIPISAGQIEWFVETGTPFQVCDECLGDPLNTDIFTLWGDPSLPKPVGVLNACP